VRSRERQGQIRSGLNQNSRQGKYGFPQGMACSQLRAMLEQTRNKLDVDSAPFFDGSRPSLDAIG
jgi:hypothetical protein